MNLDVLRERLSRPFAPFYVRTSDGREYTVKEPYTVAVGGGQVILLDERGRTVKLDALHVVAVGDVHELPGTRS
jgi:muramidase (phage lysozyme)